MPSKNVRLFASTEYEPLARELGLPRGQVERRIFPDGERYLRILDAVRECHTVLLASTASDAETLELFDLACGLVKEDCQSLTLLIPFFGYSTMERQVKTGEVVTAKTRARLLSAIPRAPSGNRVALLDLHADGITYYFEGETSPQHLYAKPLILQAIRDVGGDGFALGSVDAGRAKWVESLANELQVPASFILKRRHDARRTEVLALSAAVQGKRVVIYDDMIRTGGSLLGAARAYLDAGATSVAAVATHGVFPEGALERLRTSGLLERVVVTNSHPWALRHGPALPFLDVRSCAPVLLAYLKDLGLS